jgi:hypothetical protein
MAHISRRTAGLAGLVLAPFWYGVVLLVTLLERDFMKSLGWSLTKENEVSWPSSLGRGDVGWLLSVDFVVTAVLIALFAAGFRHEFRRKVSGAVATAGLGLCAIAVGMNAFVTDLEGEPSTWHGTLHNAGFLLFLLGMLIAYPASGLALRGNEDWRGWRLLGWTPVVLVLVVLGSGFLPGDVGFAVFLLLAWGWFSVMGAHLLAVDRAGGEIPERLPDAAAPGLL